jgi:hypothetical protein
MDLSIELLWIYWVPSQARTSCLRMNGNLTCFHRIHQHMIWISSILQLLFLHSWLTGKEFRSLCFRSKAGRWGTKQGLHKIFNGKPSLHLPKKLCKCSRRSSFPGQLATSKELKTPSSKFLNPQWYA